MATEDLVQRIPVIWCLGLLTACAAARPPAATTPARRAAPVAQARPAAPSAARVRSNRPAPVPLALELAQRDEQEDAALRKAAVLYREFIDRAGSDPTYAEAVRRSRERIADIETILRFREEGRRERRRSHGGAE